MAATDLRIIIVDDEPAHAEAIRLAFAAADIAVEIERAGTLAAYRMAVAARPPDIALVDLTLPDGGAMEVLTAPPEVGLCPALVVTSDSNEQTAMAVIKAGALDYVVKSAEAFAAMPRIVARVLREWKLLQEHKRAEAALRRRADELAALQATVLEIAAPHDLPALLHTIVERAAQLLGARSGGMYLCDPGRREVRCVVSYNTLHDYTGTILAYGEGAAGTVAQTGAPLIIDDYRVWRKRAAVYDEQQPFTAVLSAPMIWQGQVIGVIHVLDDVESKHFTEADLALLTLFANHAAIAVENTRLYEAAQNEIAERKQAEETLRESEERYQLANRATFDVIWDWNLQTDALWWNENFQILFGYHMEVIEPGIESWTNRIHPDDLARVEAGIHAAIDSGRQSWSDHYRFRRQDGAYAEIDDRGYISRETGGKPVRMIGAMQDVTGRAQAEQHAFELALERERMALLGKFVQDASHEFRTPLSIIQTNVYLLERLEDGPKRQRKLAQIGDQVTGLIRLVDLLGEITRLDSGVPFTTQPTDLNRLIGAVADKLQGAAAAKSLALHLVLAPGLPLVSADGNRLGRALDELLDNAVRFTPAGGRVTVRTGWRMADGGWRIDDVEPVGKNLQSAIGHPQWVTVEVQDTGPGIPPDVLPHVFERFYRQDAAHTTPGFGLGLPIARAIVERHGGRLEVESRPGAGSVFRILLPA